VNNPIEAVSHWKAGNLKPLCVFDKERMPMTDKVTADKSWSDIPTCRESGVDFDYLMLRGIFMPPEVSEEQVAFYVDLLQKVRETPEWKEFMATGAFNTTFMTGQEFADWLAQAEETHKSLMQAGGFIPGS
jgi:putative tricarboxylic transport membrane protein